jgi:hypothetical protein
MRRKLSHAGKLFVGRVVLLKQLVVPRRQIGEGTVSSSNTAMLPEVWYVIAAPVVLVHEP